MADNGIHWRTELNNYLQEGGNKEKLEWETHTTGPEHNLTWHASAKYDGIEAGSGSASTMAGAKELAAERALSTLSADRHRGVIDHHQAHGDN